MIWHFHNAIEGITRKTVDQYSRSRILSSYFSSFYFVGCGWTINRRRTRHPAEDLFSIREISMKLPDNAGIEPSISCPECREPVMKSKIETPANDFFAGDAWKESGHRAVYSCQWFIGQDRGPAKVYTPMLQQWGTVGAMTRPVMGMPHTAFPNTAGRYGPMRIWSEQHCHIYEAIGPGRFVSVPRLPALCGQSYPPAL
jgi:hypothetical protein